MRITIVTPTLNRADHLPMAIESVLQQGHDNVEHIIVDGMSTDNTMEVLALYPHLRVIQEPDTGLYEALNKGIRAATGTIIGHLNSDDCYTPGAFEAVLKAFTPGMEVVSGGAEILEDGHRVKQRYLHEDEIGLTFFNVTAGPLIPNARFISKRLYQLVGLYNLKYRVAADREFLFRALMAGPRATEIEQVLYQYRWHPGSLTFSDNPEREARWREEYLELAEGYLDRKDLTLDAVEGARLWHLRESAQAATRAVLDREWKKAGGYARRGVRRNPKWPVDFLRHLAGAVLRR
ncbi:MAG TPA: glycosyltransferase family 2 protein [Chthoniobacteraceae bacterium]|jgi:glycosyltransferase involved in cell wall biosynthesis|nr:glycosyltransferase family 2 protein [Chthoniobacteraceae bacterium]